MKRLIVSGITIAALGLSAVSCGDGGPSAKCVDWDHDKVKVTVTPKPGKTWDTRLKKWVTGPTPKPYVTESMKVECEEWETQSPAPTES